MFRKYDQNVRKAIKKGIYNPGISAGVLMPEEYEVKRFQDWIRHKLQ